MHHKMLALVTGAVISASISRQIRLRRVMAEAFAAAVPTVPPLTAGAARSVGKVSQAGAMVGAGTLARRYGWTVAPHRVYC
jgi:hypothetical protein